MGPHNWEYWYVSHMEKVPSALPVTSTASRRTVMPKMALLGCAAMVAFSTPVAHSQMRTYTWLWLAQECQNTRRH